jgi:hypothetical protein
MRNMAVDDTQGRVTRNLKRNALFLKFPEEYYQYALQWCAYPHWTLEEAANLLTGCVPHREMFLRGPEHVALDEEVLATENQLRAAINGRLEVVKSKTHFGKTYLLAEQVFDWARQEQFPLPDDLVKAEQLVHHRYSAETYSTPCLEAARWVVENFWENANLREPPRAGVIIQALLQKYPDLSGAECDMIEKLTRHPLTRLN